MLSRLEGRVDELERRLAAVEYMIADQRRGGAKRRKTGGTPDAGVYHRAAERAVAGGGSEGIQVTARHRELRANARMWATALRFAKQDAVELMEEAHAARRPEDRCVVKTSLTQRGTYLHNRALRYIARWRGCAVDLESGVARVAPETAEQRAEEVRAMEDWPYVTGDGVTAAVTVPAAEGRLGLGVRV